MKSQQIIQKSKLLNKRGYNSISEEYYHIWCTNYSHLHYNVWIGYVYILDKKYSKAERFYYKSNNGTIRVLSNDYGEIVDINYQL